MKNNFYSNCSLQNVYIKPSNDSEVSSQILYGERFLIISKNKKWVKIKTSYDNYTGFIKNNKFIKDFRPTHKIFKLKSQVFKKLKNKFIPLNKFIYFASRIMLKKQDTNFIEFDKNRWIKKKDIKKISHIEKNFTKIFKLFLKTKYLWGGKSCDGIDCSALIQMYYYYNNLFFPRDTKDQIKYCKNKSKKNYKPGTIIFWKGHVGICLKNNTFIHAYGPRKKVLIMKTDQAISLIQKTAKLEVKKISSIVNY
ncbi:C40 family peptidase [Candidatus Pelagibacter sp.]|nr:C40 family peptidase [Candidatus Pelagibacter sp.]